MPNTTWCVIQWVKEGSQIQIHVFLIQSSNIHTDSQSVTFFPILCDYFRNFWRISKLSQHTHQTYSTLNPRQKQFRVCNTRRVALHFNMNFCSALQLSRFKNMDCFCCPKSKSNCSETSKHSRWSSKCSWCCWHSINGKTVLQYSDSLFAIKANTQEL